MKDREIFMPDQEPEPSAVGAITRPRPGDVDRMRKEAEFHPKERAAFGRVEIGEIPGAEHIPPEKRELAKKIRNALVTGVKNWAQNLDPRGKDKAWLAGAAVGTAESVAMFALPPGPANGWIKAGGNLLLAQGMYAGTKGFYSLKERRVKRAFTGDELLGKLEEIKNKHAIANGKLKNFLLGVSAGATYATATGLVGPIATEVAKEVASGVQINLSQISIPEIKLPTVRMPDVKGGIEKLVQKVRGLRDLSQLPDDALKKAIAEGGVASVDPATFEKLKKTLEERGITEESLKKATEQQGVSGMHDARLEEAKKLLEQRDIAIPSLPTTAEAAVGVLPEVQKTVEAVYQNPDYLTQKAALVGRELPISDEIIKKVLEQKGMRLSELDPATVEKARRAIQTVFENQANTSFDSSLQTLLSSNPSTDFNTVVETGQKSFMEWMSNQTTQQELFDLAQKQLSEGLQVQDALASQVTESLQADPSLFLEKAIERGTTVGKMLQEAGYAMTWTGQDAKVLGAHIAANYDTLSNMWQNMAVHQPNVVPDVPFSVSLSELNDLVSKAQMGDKEALKKLLQALHWIPAGSKFKILRQAGIDQALSALQ